MAKKEKPSPDRKPLTDEELERLTADEFVKLKLSDDEKSALRAINLRKREENERKVQEWINEQQPLADELNAAGFNVESAWDLFNRKEPWNKKERVPTYPEALSILLKHLERPYPDRMRDGIARALAVGQAEWVAAGIDIMSAWETLTRFYCQEKAGTETKDGLAVAISALARSDDRLLEGLIDLAKDVRHGESRKLLLNALARSSDPHAKVALMALGSDPQLSREVQAIFHREPA